MKKWLDFLLYIGVKYNIVEYAQVATIEQRLLNAVRDAVDKGLAEAGRGSRIPRPVVMETAPVMPEPVAEPVVSPEKPALFGKPDVGQPAVTARVTSEPESRVAMVQEAGPQPVSRPEESTAATKPVVEVPASPPPDDGGYAEMDMKELLERLYMEEKEILISNNPKLQDKNWSRGLFKNWLDMAVRRRLRELNR
ncbi:hypothetical protein JW905_04040 [bacterium]|nr:hypothetical protein [candidate division CSSED10-310 bacterium]